MKKKELYAAPESEVLEIALEQAILDGSLKDWIEEDVPGSWSL